jgi:SAM-dependent methyltransferase
LSGFTTISPSKYSYNTGITLPKIYDFIERFVSLLDTSEKILFLHLLQISWYTNPAMSPNYPEGSTDSDIFTDDKTTSYYSSQPAVLTEKYAETDDLYSSMFKEWLPKRGKVMDIGCGSGRDLANLLTSGFKATGVDISGEMIDAAIIHYPELAGKISISGLPALPGIEDTFDGVLCSAVLQHIPDSSLYESFRSIRKLLKDEGLFIISFPVNYPGINSKTNRDAEGRLFYIRPKEKYRFLIEKQRFELIKNSVQKDSLGREGVEWGIQVWRSAQRGQHAK